MVPSERNGFGTHLSSDVAARELDGGSHVDYDQLGLIGWLDFPIEGQESDEQTRA